MPTLTIKNVPEETVERLREQAKRHHRSMQGELMAIVEMNVGKKKRPVEEVLAEIKAMGVTSGDDSTRWVREDRDAR